ncbi:MAG: hypothetical protein AAGH64_11625 [Planctomycetota bacterium]
MVQNAIRWTLAAVALLIMGPLLTILTGLAPAPDGSGIASPALSGSIATGGVAWLVAIAIAGAYALFVTRLTTWRLGVACLGLCLVWSAWSAPTLNDLVRSEAGASIVTPLAIDGLLLTLVACACAFVCVRQAKGDDERDAPKIDAPAALGILGCAAGTLVAVFLIAQDDRVGQTLGAAVVAGFAGGTLGRALAPKSPQWVILAGLPIAALAAPFVGNALTSGPLDEAVFEGGVSSLLRVMPAHFAAGVLIGFPAGAAQADALAEKSGGDTASGAGKPARRAATT